VEEQHGIELGDIDKAVEAAVAVVKANADQELFDVRIQHKAEKGQVATAAAKEATDALEEKFALEAAVAQAQSIVQAMDDKAKSAAALLEAAAAVEEVHGSLHNFFHGSPQQIEEQKQAEIVGKRIASQRLPSLDQHGIGQSVAEVARRRDENSEAETADRYFDCEMDQPESLEGIWKVACVSAAQD